MINLNLHIKIMMNLIFIHDLKVLCNLMTNLIESVFVRFNKLDVINVENQIDLLFVMHSQADVSLAGNEV